jgi:hypothetical protein
MWLIAWTTARVEAAARITNDVRTLVANAIRNSSF